MLTTTFRHSHKLIGEWRRRARDRRELAMLGELDRRDLGYPCDLHAEVSKPFWRA